MRTVERDLDRVLTLLRNRIHERGFTQIEVQEVLGWGRSYISQLLTKQKTLRIEQVLQILNVITVDPAEFWAEVYQFGSSGEIRGGFGRRGRAAMSLPAADASAMLADLRRSRSLLEGLVTVLTRKNLITAGALDGATKKFRDTMTTGQDGRAPTRRHQ